jgi:hypothetical protein
MILVKVELHSAITRKVTELTRMSIANDGTGTDTTGNYDVHVARTRRNGKVRGHKRRAHHIGRLVAQAFAAAFPEERCAGAESVLDAAVMRGLGQIALAYVEALKSGDAVPSEDIQAALQWLTDGAADAPQTPGLASVLGGA